jgi:hypothetical protein
MKVSQFHASLPLAVACAVALASPLFLPAGAESASTPNVPAIVAAVDETPPAPQYDFDVYMPRVGAEDLSLDDAFEFVDPLQYPVVYANSKHVLDENPIEHEGVGEPEGREYVYLLERPDESGAFALRCVPIMLWLAPSCVDVIEAAAFGGGYRSSPFPGIGCTFINAQLRVRFVGGGGTRSALFNGGIPCGGGPSTFTGPCPSGGLVRARFFCAVFNI